MVTNLRLPGQYDERLLGSLGLQGPYYNWNRWYLPSVGRYLELDPIAKAGGFNGFYGPNWYGYAEGNPLRFIDRLGLDVTGMDYQSIAVLDSLMRDPNIGAYLRQLDADHSIDIFVSQNSGTPGQQLIDMGGAMWAEVNTPGNYVVLYDVALANKNFKEYGLDFNANQILAHELCEIWDRLYAGSSDGGRAMALFCENALRNGKKRTFHDRPRDRCGR